MNERDRFEKMILWYPPSWRARYGEEFTALLSDGHGAGRVPFGVRLSLMRRGLHERARESGVLGDALEGTALTRAGSLLVLWGWACFMVAGAIVAKFAEHWQVAVTVTHRALPGGAFGVVQIAGMLGGLIVLVAAVIAMPGFVALLRAGQWSDVRRPITRTVVAGVAATLSTLAVVLWSHSLNSPQRNGTFLFHGLVFVLWGLTMVIALATATAASVSVARRITWSPRIVRLFGTMAIALTVLMLGIIAGTVIWWSAMADYAPRFLGSGLLASSNVVPSALVLAALLMLVGVVVASIGAIRIVQSTQQSRHTT